MFASEWGVYDLVATVSIKWFGVTKLELETNWASMFLSLIRSDSSFLVLDNIWKQWSILEMLVTLNLSSADFNKLSSLNLWNREYSWFFNFRHQFLESKLCLAPMELWGSSLTSRESYQIFWISTTWNKVWCVKTVTKWELSELVKVTDVIRARKKSHLANCYFPFTLAQSVI